MKLEDVARYTAMRLASCDEGVTRQGEFQPCEKVAVAIRIDPEDDGYYPVCAYHSRAPMLPLADLLIAWKKQLAGTTSIHSKTGDYRA